MISISSVTSLMLGKVPEGIAADPLENGVWSCSRLFGGDSLSPRACSRRCSPAGSTLGWVWPWMQLALFAAVYYVTGSYMPIEAFIQSNVDRVLITPLGVLALSVGLGCWSAEGLAREVSTNLRSG